MNVSKAFELLIAIAAASISCKNPSAERSAYLRLHRELNPALLRLQPQIRQILLAPNQTVDDARALISRCKEAEDDLFTVHRVDDRGLGPGGASFSVGQWLDHKNVMCNRESDYMIEKCAHWCQSNAMILVDVIETLRGNAAREGVAFASLWPDDSHTRTLPTKR